MSQVPDVPGQLKQCAEFTIMNWGCLGHGDKGFYGSGKFWSKQTRWWGSAKDCSEWCNECIDMAVASGWRGIKCYNDVFFAECSIRFHGDLYFPPDER
ncbi:hypothetical protein E2P81_ATG04525 [Venturia nashicola]|nr:hypothetical protein E2P81_ATG04525 [Venturia nashicola]